MKTTAQTHESKEFKMNSKDYQRLQKKIREEKADFDKLLDAIIADPGFELRETMHTINAYFEKWKPEFKSLGITE